MSDSQDDQTDGGTGWLASLGDFFNDGLIQRLVLGKPAARAISRLIGAGMDVPVAGLENLTERIKADTAGRKKVQGALATAAAKAGIADEGLVDRTVTRWAGDALRKQQAREDVAVQAVKILANDPPVDGVAMGPSDDFMSYFENVVETASSDALRDLLARILAGEIRKPGSLSRLTLQAVSVMDQSIAQALWDIRPWVLKGDWVPLVGKYDTRGPKRNDIELLDSVSILRVGGGIRTLRFNDDREALLMFQSRSDGVIVQWKSASPSAFIDGASVPQIGRELLAVLPPNLETVTEEVALGFKAVTGIVQVEVCQVRHLGNEIQVNDRRVV